MADEATAQVRSADGKTESSQDFAEGQAKAALVAASPMPTIEKALEKVPDKDARAILQMAVSRTSFGLAPTPKR